MSTKHDSLLKAYLV